MDIMSYLMGQNNAIKKGMKVEVVTELPDTGVANVIYLVPKEDTGDNDIFDEYLWVEDDWEHIGTTDIDLSNYYTKSETNAITGLLANLGTTDKTSLVNAINELVSSSGKLQTLTDDTLYIDQLNIGAYILGEKVKHIRMTGKTGGYNTAGYSKGVLLVGQYRGSTKVAYLFSSEKIFIFYVDPIFTSEFITKQITPYNISASDDSETITGTKSFSTLPQSSIAPTSNNQFANKKYVDDITGALSSLDTTDKTNLVNAINEVLAGSGGDSEAVKVLYLDDYSSSSNALDMSKFETGLYIILRKREGNTMYMKPRASASARGLQNATGFNNLTLLLYSNQLPETYDSNARGFTIFQLNPNSFGYWVYTDYNTYFDAAWNTVVESVSVANNQTITGTKNFSTLPVSSVTPTFNNQLVNKQYVDDSIAAAITTTLGGNY